MKKADVIAKLKAEGAVKIFEGRSTDVENGEREVVHKLVPIFYFTQTDDNVLSERKMLELIEDGDKVDYYKGLPDILKQEPEPVEQREFIMSVEKIVSDIEAMHLADNPDWAGEVYADSVDRLRRNSRDVVFVDIANHEGVVEPRKQFMVSSLSAEPWVQPTGAHDAYNKSGEHVSHNGKVWENTHGAGNSWEPGGTGIADTIWKEVDAVRIRPVQSNS